ncbi:MAG: Bax inhibitor-1/YccA family protein [Anaerolineae bacterium]|nr:Bax inhibitor-1/YccA family protein [Anaerolineae bacterium]
MAQYNTSKPIVGAVPRVEIQPLMRQVYMWMTLGLLVTTAIGVVISAVEPLRELALNPIVLFGSIIVQLGLVFGLSFGIRRFSARTASIMFFVYAAMMGLTLSLILLVYSGTSVALAAGTTAVLFGVMTMIGYTTNLDLTKFRTLALGALIALVVASLLNLFLNSSALYWIITYAGVIIFTGLIAYDTQRIKNMASDPSIEAQGTELVQKIAIMGALALYLDVINLFLFLLRIFGGGRR